MCPPPPHLLPRRLSALGLASVSVQVALLLLLEVLLGPLWVWLRFGDVPTPWTVAGGALLLAVLAAHECAGRRRGSMPSAASAGVAPAPLDEEKPYHAMNGKSAF